MTRVKQNKSDSPVAFEISSEFQGIHRTSDSNIFFCNANKLPPFIKHLPLKCSGFQATGIPLQSVHVRDQFHLLLLLLLMSVNLVMNTCSVSEHGLDQHPSAPTATCASPQTSPETNPEHETKNFPFSVPSSSL